MRILRAADRVAVPWKNGGGVTREVCAMPESAGFDFGWRLSIAEVDASSAFSHFPLVDRTLAVIKGRMRLSVDGQMSPELRFSSPALPFAGEASAFAEVIEPVVDANLMTRRGSYEGSLEWLKITKAVVIGERNADTVLLAVEPMESEGLNLQPRDAIWCEPESFVTVAPLAEDACALVAKIWRSGARATLRP